MTTNVNVIVRVRPLLPREDSECLVRMPADEPGVTYVDHPKGVKSYVFDESVWSHSETQMNYKDNLSFYRSCGYNLLEHLYQGFNVCLLAYGQTGSGKTYTMMGAKEDYGIIPLVVRDVLRQKTALIKDKINCEVTFSYVEIYNEKVRDLLGSSKVCRVREDPVLGPYIEGLTNKSIESFGDFCRFLNTGNALRTTASTKMNDASSRSHAVLTFTLRQTRFEDDADSGQNIGTPVEEIVSNIKLVDLAGSERLAKTQVYNQADRLKEGSQINKSLTVLGRCISILSLGAKAVVPYRDSVLTYLLRENLSGNSRTSMIFCISPTDYVETCQTLGYATQVKKIKTKAKASASKLLTLPIDFEALQKTDQSTIEVLKDEIEALNKQLQDKAKGDDKGLSSLVTYLSRESERQTFEIKYLRNEARIKHDAAKELKAQNWYLGSEIKTMLQNQLQREHQRLLECAGDLMERCGEEADVLQELLTQFSKGRRHKALG
ncbi:hypothetical protein HF325_000203 [Metschnikowia pulcherrima]|uniref:Kinesin motor domain-containing protein n=1 Tax=Metschnikowia pulcherrima TaxID=27326 RepID=A0A8H7GYS7_9ASCO|nr:hypothetical protein HF325_000203 [Metschnikowia pulcherrima]